MAEAQTLRRKLSAFSCMLEMASDRRRGIERMKVSTPAEPRKRSATCTMASVGNEEGVSRLGVGGLRFYIGAHSPLTA